MVVLFYGVTGVTMAVVVVEQFILLHHYRCRYEQWYIPKSDRCYSRLVICHDHPCWWYSDLVEELID